MSEFFQTYGSRIFFGIALLFMVFMHSGRGHQHGMGGGCGMGHEHGDGHQDDRKPETTTGLSDEPASGQPPALPEGTSVHGHHAHREEDGADLFMKPSDGPQIGLRREPAA